MNLSGDLLLEMHSLLFSIQRRKRDKADLIHRPNYRMSVRCPCCCRWTYVVDTRGDNNGRRYPGPSSRRNALPMGMPNVYSDNYINNLITALFTMLLRFSVYGTDGSKPFDPVLATVKSIMETHWNPAR